MSYDFPQPGCAPGYQQVPSWWLAAGCHGLPPLGLTMVWLPKRDSNWPKNGVYRALWGPKKLGDFWVASCFKMFLGFLWVLYYSQIANLGPRSYCNSFKMIWGTSKIL